MSADLSVSPHPSPPPRNAAEPAARESELQREVEALRQENAHLRRAYAGLMASPPVEPGHGTLRTPPSNGVSLPLTTPLSDASPNGHTQLEYEALYAALASAFPIGMFRADAAGVLTHVDDALQRIFELEAADFPNFGWLMRVHPDDLEHARREWTRGVLQAEACNVELRLQRPKSGLASVIVRNTPLRDDQGQLFGQLGFVQDVTALRELEADARIKDELNRQIIASSPDCTKVLDLGAHVIQMTEKGCQLVEVDHFDQVRGSNWIDWWPPESQAGARQAISQALAGRTGRFIAFGQTFKQTPKWWDTVVTPILDNDGDPVLLLAVSRDITEQHQQEEEIRQLNARLETHVRERTAELAQTNERLRQTLQDAQDLYNHAPCGYHSLDRHGVFQLINQTELDWLGRPRQEVQGRLTFRDVYPAEVHALTAQRLLELVETGQVDPYEMQIPRAGGLPMTVLVSSVAVLDSQGQFLHTNSTLIDITDRKAAEVALQSQRDFLQNMANGVPVQLSFYDQDLVCRFANASYARWLNTPPEALIGKHLSQIARSVDYNASIERLQAALRGEPQQFEGSRAFPDGHHFYASIEYTPYWDQGQVRGLFIQMHDITERKASEDTVQRTNLDLQVALELAEGLYNQAPCGYHSLDAQGVYVMINDTELSWLGYARKDIIGVKKYSDFVLPSRIPLLEDRLARLLRDGVLEEAEYEMRRKDGSLFTALLSSSAVRDAQGRFLRSNTTVMDITARKAAESALRENQRFLQTITDHVPGMIAYLDTSLRFRFANAEHLHVYGLDPVQMLGAHISECVPPNVWNEIQPYLQVALKGQPQQFESWRSTVSGQPIYISAQYLPDVHEGVVQGVFVQIMDITERKRIEERISQLNDELERRIRERSLELLESEQRFRLMVDNLREYCIFFLDAQGHVTDWTDSAQRLEGYSPTEVIGQHYSMLFRNNSPEAARQSADRMLRLAASRGQHELHSWHLRKDGSNYWSHSLLIALRDEAGELKGFAKINRDMTDAKRLDDLMRNINDELENRVIERTEQLTAANQDLESFSYSVSHDLRSPLRHISSFVSLLEEHLSPQEDETTQRYLTTIGNSARHMSQLIDGLLAFSRLGRSAVSQTAVDLSLLVETVVNHLRHDAGERTVHWVIPSDLPVVKGDALLLREVWANLLGNALKYTRPREQARIEIAWSVDPAVGYTFDVCDNGVGFDPQFAQKLFGVFQRMHRASEFEGTGIGLALTRRILERHGGSIWAESAVGLGSIFHFSLPFDGLMPADPPLDSIPSALEP